MEEANLLISFSPTHQESAKSEIETVLKEIGEEFQILNIKEGIAELKVKDAREVIKKISAKLEQGYSFEYLFKWWPVDVWCKAEIPEMQEKIKELQEKIGNEEKWKMELEKRRAKEEYPADLIIKLTEVIEKPKVDLTNPEKIIKVEIIEDKAAISLITQKDIIKSK